MSARRPDALESSDDDTLDRVVQAQRHREYSTTTVMDMAAAQ